MNIFYIPSWYPDARGRLTNGVFFQEAALAVAHHHPAVKIMVSLWSQGERELSSARLRAWFAHPGFGGPSRPARRAVLANLIELHRPAWSWRYGVRRGNIEAILERNRLHFAQARAEPGGIDLIHAQVSFPAGYIGMRLAAEAGIPYMVSEHMGPFPFRHFESRGSVVADVAEPLRRASLVTAVSRALARQIRDKVGVEASVLPNGVDEAFFTPRRHDANGFTFLTVAHLEDQKGIDDLLRAIARLGAAGAARFRIAGGGARAREYRALAQALGVEDRVEWLGPLDRAQVRESLQACDCFVLTSRHESFGVVYTEALACGVPIIATRCGGPEDIVQAGNGLLVGVGDVDGIAAALATMLGQARSYDSAAIRADFEARFGSRVIAQRLVARYEEVARAC